MRQQLIVQRRQGAVLSGQESAPLCESDRFRLWVDVTIAVVGATLSFDSVPQACGLVRVGRQWGQFVVEECLAQIVITPGDGKDAVNLSQGGR